MTFFHKFYLFTAALAISACLCGCSSTAPDTNQSTETSAPPSEAAASSKTAAFEETAAVTETESAAAEEEEDGIDRQIEDMSLDEKVDQLFFITPEQLTGMGTVTQAGDTTREAIKKHPVGGLIYFEQNLEDPEQTKKLLSGTQHFYEDLGKVQPFLGVDEEGGTVARIAKNSAFGVTNVGNMVDIGNTGDSSKAYEAGNTIGTYLHDLGFNLDFAPVADVLTNPNNTVVAKRAFGSDPALVSSMALQEVKALEAQQVVPVVKHFPGHGATTDDTHEGYAYTDKTLEEMMASDLVPFADAAKENVPMMMAGHISAPNVTGDNTPASLSEKLITGVLRQQLGYGGVVITDAMNMGAIANTYSSGEAAVKAIQAGADMILMPYDFAAARSGILDAVKNGTISEERIDESVRRILEVKRRMVLSFAQNS